MSFGELSNSDLALLEALRAELSKQPQVLTADFYAYLASQDHPQTGLLKQSFEQLLLNDHESILDAIAIDAFMTPKQLISLFDQYLGCMAIRVPEIISDNKQAQQIIEAIRKLAFDLLQRILAKQNSSGSQSVRKLSRKTDVVFEHVMSQEQFIIKANQLLGTEHEQGIAILGIQFDFGTHSNNAVQPVLASIAVKLRQIVSQHDLVTHISTRRWAICLRHTNEASRAIAAVKKMQAQFSKPMIINGVETKVTPYTGIALSSVVAKDADFLLQAALKISSIPAHQPEHYRVYDPALDAEAKRLDYLSSELKTALLNDQLDLYYQPKYSIKQNKIIGLETLLRWQHDGEAIPIPLIFQLIERNGLLRQFTQWLLEKTFGHFLEFLKLGVDIRLSVNILPQNLDEPGFKNMLSTLLDAHRVPRDKLTIEITEGTLLEDADGTIETLQELRDMGLSISLDDFGTGYSSLSYLSRLPINEIKIDQSFVRNLFRSERDEAIVRTIIELGNNFRLDFVAEGVEDSATAEKLAAIGCDVMQGFWISKPVSYLEVLNWFQNDEKQVWKRLKVIN